MRLNYFFFCFFINILFFSATSHSQTINFDETWKEFLANNKISNMSALAKPDKAYKLADYAKYLLMNTNTNFCQSEIEDAEKLMAEIQTIDAQVHNSIPRYVEKLDDLEKKIKAYHSMDAVWAKFLKTKEVSLDELEAIKDAKTSCEKSTLAKYSYMKAYHHFCLGNIERSKDIFENRTLRLAEKTSLRVEDVEGLAEEVAKMKSLYQNLSKLDIAWTSYVETGVSPGFDMELPLFSCNPIPNMKELVLRGAVDICNSAPEMLEKVKELEKETGVAPVGSVTKKIKKLEKAIKQNEKNLATLNKTWMEFIPENKVTAMNYSYEYCTNEPLVKAYIMDGFSFVCELAEESLEKIAALRESDDDLELDDVTLAKIDELVELNIKYQFNGEKIEVVWKDFLAEGAEAFAGYESTEIYCDNIHQVKDWLIKGHTSVCENRQVYLESIEDFQKTFEFSFTEELECQVQSLRIKLWDCRYEILEELASLDVSTDDPLEKKIKALMTEYEMGERPEVCSVD